MNTEWPGLLLIFVIMGGLALLGIEFMGLLNTILRMH